MPSLEEGTHIQEVLEHPAIQKAVSAVLRRVGRQAKWQKASFWIVASLTSLAVLFGSCSSSSESDPRQFLNGLTLQISPPGPVRRGSRFAVSVKGEPPAELLALPEFEIIDKAGVVQATVRATYSHRDGQQGVPLGTRQTLRTPLDLPAGYYELRGHIVGADDASLASKPQ